MDDQNRERLGDVAGQLVDLLRQYGEVSKADWLDQRLARLTGQPTTVDSMAQICDELRRIVAGMGGLTDMVLQGSSGVQAWDDTQRLYVLAQEMDRLCGSDGVSDRS